MKAYIKRWQAFVTNPALVFLSLASLFGLLAIAVTPQLVVSDENQHFLRSYTLSMGTIGKETCTYPVEINKKASGVYVGDLSANYTDKINFQHTEQAPCGTASAYSPFMHLPQALGMFAAKLIYPSTGLLILFGQLANLALYISVLYFIIKHVRLGKWVFVVIGLFPSMIHTAASLSSDVVHNSIILASAAVVFSLFTQTSRLSQNQIILVTLLACGLALTKVTNLLVFLPLLFLSARIFIPNTTKLPFNLHKWLLVIGIGIVSILSLLLWQKLYGGTLVSETPPNILAEYPHHFVKVLFNTYINPSIEYTDKILQGVVGYFASYSYYLPAFMIFANLSLLGIVLFRRNKHEEQEIKKTSPLVWSSLIAITLSIIAITYALYVIWAVQPWRLGPTALYADGVQGRYFTALLILLVPVAIWLRKFIAVDIKNDTILGTLVFLVAGSSLLFFILQTFFFFK